MLLDEYIFTGAFCLTHTRTLFTPHLSSSLSLSVCSPLLYVQRCFTYTRWNSVRVLKAIILHISIFTLTCRPKQQNLISTKPEYMIIWFVVSSLLSTLNLSLMLTCYWLKLCVVSRQHLVVTVILVKYPLFGYKQHHSSIFWTQLKRKLCSRSPSASLQTTVT